MISETTVMMLIAIQFGFMAFVLMKIEIKKGESERFKTEIETSLATLQIPDLNIEELKADLVELVEDMMASIRIPTILDHVGGIASMFMQQKMAKMQELPQMMAEQMESFAEEDF